MKVCFKIKLHVRFFKSYFLPEKAYNDPDFQKNVVHAQFCAPCSYNAKGKLMPY